MPGIEMDEDEDWKTTFLQNQPPATPPHDDRHGWKLTAVTITLGILAILALST